MDSYLIDGAMNIFIIFNWLANAALAHVAAA